MLNGFATVKEPPTHPSFAYTYPSKNRSQPFVPQFSNNIQNLINPFFSNLLQKDLKHKELEHLNKLSDMQFETCGVTAIGDIETISEAAQKYNR
ncbi:hypothetical protein GLOIN_2v1477641 [Rhizophagus clarus]|uniref:Uncharacterized protein n=1 Tax=Rhizophagus clarus TaxID=94130 RepID=A0A8H3KW29_9GLOM|nr:hypothetical protein GLOIN_2v1477641 [Rhizophagus clarus]